MKTPRTPSLQATAATVVIRWLAGAVLAATTLASHADDLPGRLVQPVSPKHYDLSIQPDEDFLHFQGHVEIELQIDEEVSSIKLSAAGLDIREADIDGTPIAYDLQPDEQTVTFNATQPVKPGAHVLAIDYRGSSGEEIDGMYHIDYQDGDKQWRLLATQMEPTGARRMLPCFDEPRFKATFSVTALVPHAFSAISNGEIASRTPLDEKTDRVSFEPSLPMASYLVALFIGPFEHVEEVHDGVTIRVHTMPGKSQQAREALAVASAVLPFYGDYFGVSFPLKKLDEIAIPGGFRGAMENWGAIAYNEGALLYNPTSDTPEQRTTVWSVSAHEIAHQWFGDLVTMAWWDDTWLNEGFASWMAAKAVDRFHPEWQASLNDQQRAGEARDEDALGVAGAIHRNVVDDRSATDLFDRLSYDKGEALINMVESLLGEDGFRDGLRRYMDQHKYGNATTGDLWKALDQAGDSGSGGSGGSGNGGKSVTAMADHWIREPGVPLIEVARHCDRGAGSVTLSQRPFRFLESTATNSGSWEVPVRLGIGAKLETSQVVLVVDQPVSVTLPTCDTPVKINLGNRGYYRAHYDERSRHLMLQALASMPVSTPDRLDALTNTVALYWAGKATLGDFTETVRAFEGESQPRYWDSVADAIRDLDNAAASGRMANDWKLERPAIIASLKSADHVHPAATAGTDTVKLFAERREYLYRSLGRLDDSATIVDARIRYATDQGAREGPAMAQAVLAVVARHARPFEFDAMLTRLRKSNDERERRHMIDAIATVKDPALAQRVLDMMVDPETPGYEVGDLPRRVAQSGHEAMAWSFVTDNWSRIGPRVGLWNAGSIIAEVGRRSTDPARADQIVPTIQKNVGAFAEPAGKRAAQWSRVLVHSQSRG